MDARKQSGKHCLEDQLIWIQACVYAHISANPITFMRMLNKEKSQKPSYFSLAVVHDGIMIRGEYKLTKIYLDLWLLFVLSTQIWAV